jgi:hypothetical protein
MRGTGGCAVRCRRVRNRLGGAIFFCRRQIVTDSVQAIQQNRCLKYYHTTAHPHFRRIPPRWNDIFVLPHQRTSTKSSFSRILKSIISCGKSLRVASGGALIPLIQSAGIRLVRSIIMQLFFPMSLRHALLAAREPICYSDTPRMIVSLYSYRMFVSFSHREIW